jgi:hypothetical protein
MGDCRRSQSQCCSVRRLTNIGSAGAQRQCPARYLARCQASSRVSMSTSRAGVPAARAVVHDRIGREARDVGERRRVQRHRRRTVEGGCRGSDERVIDADLAAEQEHVSVSQVGAGRNPCSAEFAFLVAERQVPRRVPGHEAEHPRGQLVVMDARVPLRGDRVLAGFQVHVPKPVDPQYLRSVVARLAFLAQGSRGLQEWPDRASHDPLNVRAQRAAPA